MDLNYSPDENAFRHEVRAFLTESLPGSLRRKVLAGIYHSREEQAGVGCARRTAHAETYLFFADAQW